ncbi:protein LONGIFOLIA 1-like [Durio zibethinus]|uniref:Protein LONGIFOLIA 1-like n=1 Tax=Durio zibethinus TaxID=66656 RepID=A0A6P5XIH9_DURZI|nr:protein LONGIFOLIA 1-like [Durio zibethinus]
MTKGIVQDQNLEKQIGKQMGCMAGFLQIFDRHQIPTSKRLYSSKRLPPTPASKTIPEQEKNAKSPALSREFEKQPLGRSASSPDQSKRSPVTSELRTPAPEPSTPTENQNKTPLPLPIFDFKEGSARSPWKFSKEAPRLSLDSRAILDAQGRLKPRQIRTNAAISSANQCESNSEENGVDDNYKQRRTPSVIARLMGLEPLPHSDPEHNRKAKLRRSASETRGRDLFQYRFTDGVNFHLKQGQQPNFQNEVVLSNLVRENRAKQDQITSNRPEGLRNARTEPFKAPVQGMGQRKCFYDSADFFPEPRQTVSIYGEIEKRLKLRGMDETSKDLETLKQILEALQLKGLLRTKKPPNQTNSKNLVYEHEQSPIVVVKPGRSPASAVRRIGSDSPPSSYTSRPGACWNLNLESPPTMSPRRDRPRSERRVRNQTNGRGFNSPVRSACGVKNPNRRHLSVETQRRENDHVEQRKVYPGQSPPVNVRRTGLDQTTNRSPRNNKSTAEIYQKEEKVFIPVEDEIPIVSESSIGTCSQTVTEGSKVEEYQEQRSLLERCDKLLHSIAEMNATTELQPSPVSVFDSSFYKEESSPSPVIKRNTDFKDKLIESEDELWSPAIPSAESKSEDKSDDCDFIYISDILSASNYLPDDSDVFMLLEKQQFLKGKDSSKVSSLQRKLIFDTINEIFNRKRQLPPWKLIYSGAARTSLQQIWSEFQKIRERDSSDDLFEVIFGVLRKDLAGDAINGWGDCPIEMSEAVLDIERLIFKDLIGETIEDLAAFVGKCNKIPAPRRKLVF